MVPLAPLVDAWAVAHWEEARAKLRQDVRRERRLAEAEEARRRAFWARRRRLIFIRDARLAKRVRRIQAALALGRWAVGGAGLCSPLGALIVTSGVGALAYLLG